MDTLKEPFLEKETEPNSKITSILLLAVTVVLEAAGTVLLKYSLQEQLFYCVAYACYFLSLTLFSIVLRDIPLSIAYTTWCTLGTIGVALFSHVFFDERIGPLKWGCILGTIPCLAGLYLLP